MAPSYVALLPSDAPSGDNRNLLFLHPVLCQLGLPRRPLPITVRHVERASGGDWLRLEAGRMQRGGHPVDLPLPSGTRARLALLHICTHVVRTGETDIELGETGRHVLRTLGIGSPSGHDMRRVRDQIDALSMSTITLGMTRDGDDRTVRTVVARSVVAWQGTDRGVMRLSADLVRAIHDAGVPLDGTHIATLRRSTLALDLYTWLAHRLWRVRAAVGERVSWSAIQAQFGPYGTAGRWTGDELRRAVRRALADVMTVYDRARVDDCGERGLVLRPSPPPVRRGMSMSRPPSEDIAPGEVRTSPPAGEDITPGGPRTSPPAIYRPGRDSDRYPGCRARARGEDLDRESPSRRPGPPVPRTSRVS